MGSINQIRKRYIKAKERILEICDEIAGERLQRDINNIYLEKIENLLDSVDTDEELEDIRDDIVEVVEDLQTFFSMISEYANEAANELGSFLEYIE